MLRLPPKRGARSYEVMHLSRKITLVNLKICCSKMQPVSGNQCPELWWTSLVNMSLALRLPRDMHLCGSSSNAPRLPSLLEMLQNPHVLLTCGRVHNPLHLPHETTSERPKVLRTHNFFALLTSTCALPQRRALFRHLNFQKRSEADVFCTFWLRHVLRATTAVTFLTSQLPKVSPANVLCATTTCTISTSQLPKVVRGWCALYILTWKCASRHNGVQFFIPHLARWLRTHRFSRHTFRPSGAINHWKNAMNRDFSTFLRAYIFFLLTLSLLWSSLSLLFSSLLWLFPPLLFHLPILLEVWLLNFLWLLKNMLT